MGLFGSLMGGIGGGLSAAKQGLLAMLDSGVQNSLAGTPSGLYDVNSAMQDPRQRRMLRGQFLQNFGQGLMAGNPTLGAQQFRAQVAGNALAGQEMQRYNEAVRLSNEYSAKRREFIGSGAKGRALGEGLFNLAVTYGDDKTAQVLSTYLDRQYPQEKFNTTAQQMNMPTGSPDGKTAPVMAQLGEFGTVRTVPGATPVHKPIGQPQEVTQNGKRVLVQQYDDGSLQPVTGYGPKPENTYPAKTAPGTPQLRVSDSGATSPVLMPSGQPLMTPPESGSSTLDQVTTAYATMNSPTATAIEKKAAKDFLDKYNRPPVSIMNQGSADQVASTAEAIRSGRMTLSMIPARDANFRRQVQQAVLSTDPQFNFFESEANYKYGSSAGTQNRIRMLDSVTSSIDNLAKNFKALNNPNIRSLAYLRNKGYEQFNNIDLTKVQTDVALLADELGTVFAGGTGSVVSDQKIKLAMETLGNMDASPKAQIAALDEVKALLKFRREAVTRGTPYASGSSSHGGGTSVVQQILDKLDQIK